MKKNLIINSGFVLALAILASIVFMSHWYVNQWVISDQREEYAFNVIQKLDQLLHTLREVRRSQREYTRTGKEEYHASYHEALDSVDRELTSLKSMTTAQPWLQERLAEIEPLVKAKLAERERLMENRSGRTAPGDATNGRVSMDEIHKRVAATQDETIRFLRSTSAQQNTDLRKVQQLLVITSVIMFALLSMVFLMLRRDIARRVKSEQELVKHRDQLDGLVQTRTQELVDVNRQLHLEIDERKRTDSMLQEAHRALLETLESMTDGFVSLDRQCRYKYINPTAARYMERNSAELLGQVCWEMFPGADKSLAYREIHRAMAENCFVQFEDFRPGPVTRWYENRCYPSADGVTIYFTDITERKWAEQIRRNLEEHEDSILEQERLALSREVHDEIGQSLSALKLDLAWIERRYPPATSELAERLAEMRANLGQLINTTQHITARLRPPLLDNLGLAAAIEWQAGEFTRRSGIECHLMLNEGIEADEHNSTTIMRIFQEALTNVIRHARATEVGVSLCERNDMIILEISDNGRGITMEEIDSPTAFGIMGMRERAHLCKGELTVEGSPEEGTIVRLTIPRHAGKETS